MNIEFDGNNTHQQHQPLFFQQPPHQPGQPSPNMQNPYSFANQAFNCWSQQPTNGSFNGSQPPLFAKPQPLFAHNPVSFGQCTEQGPAQEEGSEDSAEEEMEGKKPLNLEDDDEDAYEPDEWEDEDEMEDEIGLADIVEEDDGTELIT
jgi:hypothetical protein